MYFLQGISNGTVIIFCVMILQCINFRSTIPSGSETDLESCLLTFPLMSTETGACRLWNMWPGCLNYGLMWPGCLNHGRSACETFRWANHLCCAKWQMILASISWCFKLYAALKKFHLIRTRCHFRCVCAIHSRNHSAKLWTPEWSVAWSSSK